MAGWILLMGAAGFACAVRELPWWYQLLTALATLLALVGLWLTNQTDPGIIPPAAEQGAHMQEPGCMCKARPGGLHVQGVHSWQLMLTCTCRPLCCGLLNSRAPRDAGSGCDCGGS